MKLRKILSVSVITAVTIFTVFVVKNKALADEYDDTQNQESLLNTQESVDTEDTFEFIEPDTTEKNVKVKLTLEEYNQLIETLPKGAVLAIDEETIDTLPDEVQYLYK